MRWLWFIWTQRKQGKGKLRNKVYELWPRILDEVDVDIKEGKKLASQLCLWSIFVDQIDDERRNLLLKIVDYSDEAYNSNNLLESIANISQTQPFEAYAIWMKMLESSSPEYPEKAIRKILTNLVNQGPDGLRKAKDAVSEYLKLGNERPANWLREITKET